MGRSARWPSPRSRRYQAQPNMRTASATRSVTESKKAPRTEAVPAALATGPSRRSCMPVMIRKTMARWRWPVATRTAVAVAETRPVAVSTSAVMPWRCSASPTGPVVRSTAVRQRPSNMKLLVVRRPGRGALFARVYHPAPETRRCEGPPWARPGAPIGGTGVPGRTPLRAPAARRRTRLPVRAPRRARAGRTGPRVASPVEMPRCGADARPPSTARRAGAEVMVRCPSRGAGSPSRTSPCSPTPRSTSPSWCPTTTPATGCARRSSTWCACSMRRA